MKNLTLAFSSCPNDTFIFHALAHKLLKTNQLTSLEIKKEQNKLNFEITIADVETLNKYAANSIFDITKLSFATFGGLRDKYALLRSGTALGRGCGPLVVSFLKQFTNKKPVVAVPGIGTTAFVLFTLFLKENFPEIEPDIVPMPFERIMPALKDGFADFGVIIHEGRFTYPNWGLHCLVDLGKWWEDVTGLPIPLGCIAIKRDICKLMIKEETKIDGCKNKPTLGYLIQELIRQSIQYAFDNPEASRNYIKNHAQELDDKIISQHINLYVNDFSKDIGKEGEAAIYTFFKKAEKAGIMKPNTDELFI